MTQLDSPWLTAPGPRAVCDAISAAGHAVYFVGGCVRNALIGAAATDIDLATSAHPQDVIDAVEAAGLRAIPTGIDHGTVTVVAEGHGVEVTTFRRDVETDGRRAAVAFADTLEEDAARRDFTMNALYARPDGAVIDPVGGLADLAARRLRFIGDPGERIAEDYLRVLRFFRFHAWYADPVGGFDADALAACAAGAEGLSHVSAERIGHEMRKLLAAPDPAPAVAAMAQTGLLGRILPGATHESLPVLVALESDLGADPAFERRLAVLCRTPPVDALRLSRTEARSLTTLADGVESGAEAAELAYRHGPDAARDIVLLRAALTGQPIPESAEQAIADGAAAVFPVAAADLMPAYSGPALGARLAALEAHWIASGFATGKVDLLALPDKG